MMRQYIGARYTPKFMGEYNATTAYENLCVVDNGAGTTYISRKPVPPNTPLTNTGYWLVYGASSGAILDLQTRVGTIESVDLPAIEGDIDDLQEDVELLQGLNKRMITITDSYGRASDTGTSWQIELASLRPDITFYNYYEGSLGIYRNGDQGHNAQALLSLHAGDIPDHDTITDVLIGAGLNDAVASGPTQTQLESAYDSLVSYIRTTFPNAKIWFAFFGSSSAFTWDENTRYQNFIQVMADKCGDLNCVYMGGLEYIMHNRKLKLADGVHPNADGSKEIARGVNCILNGGEYHYNARLEANLTLTGGAVSAKAYFEINDGLSYLHINQVSTTATLTFSGADPLAIGTFSDSLFVNGKSLAIASVFSSDANCPETMTMFNNGNTLSAKWVKAGSHSVTVLQINNADIIMPTLIV